MSIQVGAEPLIPQWSLGDRLRKIRRTAGQSQAEFAQLLGVNQKSYASWELDTTAPRNIVALAKRIEALTGVPAAWVLGVPFLGGDTGAPTRRYAVASAGRRHPFVLVSGGRDDYVGVGGGYGSSSQADAHTPERGHSLGPVQVNHADSA